MRLVFNNLVEIPYEAVRHVPSRISHKFRKDGVFHSKTYSEFIQDFEALALGFNSEGISKNDHIAFFCNNRYEWILIDFAIMLNGAISVPRGTDSPPKELEFIFHHSDSKYLIVETHKQLEELFDAFEEEDKEKIKKIFIVENKEKNTLDLSRYKVSYIKDVIEHGYQLLEMQKNKINEMKKAINEEDLVTIIYTSGTTGNPKGVMLTHKNITHNVKVNTPRTQLHIDNADLSVTILPSWHMFERTFEYIGLAAGITLVYSSIRNFGKDMENEKPVFICSVPRVWESVYSKLMKKIFTMSKVKQYIFYLAVKTSQHHLVSNQYLHGAYLSFKKRNIINKSFTFLFHLFRLLLTYPLKILFSPLFKVIKQKTGGNINGILSGGGALPPYIDNFFNSVGITLLNAYGMTESSPGIMSREFHKNTLGATGSPFPEMEVKLLNKEGKETDIGEKGILYVRSDSVMKGYYKNKKATKENINEDGWLITGDIGIKSENGDIVLVGRDKNTIVLSGGENVDPEPIEDKLKESIYIDHAVVLGQDKKRLTALIALNEEEVAKLAKKLKISTTSIFKSSDKEKDIVKEEKLNKEIKKEVNKLISKEHGFKPFEMIGKVIPIKNDFKIGKELTETLKIKRKYIVKKYNEIINLFTDDEQTKIAKKRLKKKKKFDKLKKKQNKEK